MCVSLRGVRAAQHGVTMVEVLVAVVVLALGLLGLAGLQASGLRVGQSSLYRTQAAQLAFDMADRLRANPDGVAAGAYDRTLTDVAPTGTTLPELELREWLQRLALLPNGRGAVAVNGAAATIVVEWDDRRGAGVLRDATDAAALAQQQTQQFTIITELSNF